MTNQAKPEEIAVNRYKIIAPILAAVDEQADTAKLVVLKRETCEQNGVSRRTLDRWLSGYDACGFDGLKPVNRTHSKPGVISEDLIDEAIQLRREVPSRSISQIIEILEMEGRAPVGLIKRTTLQDRLRDKGYTARQMRMYQNGGLASRRFQRQERGDMWHSDIKYGPFLNIGGGKKKQIYLVSFLDDATRYVVHGEFYDSLDQTVVEDCFRKAVLKEGLPRRVYFDNGKQYRTKWMERACAILGIKLLYAKPYSPESTGKIERFNRTVDSFLDEAAVHCKKMTDYNRYFKIWLQECYHNRKHGGLNGNTPEIAYKTSKSPLRFVPQETIASAFMRMERRKVDKSGCISFGGKKYEVSALLAGRMIDVTYDPNDIQTLTVEHDGKAWRVSELQIGTHTGPRPKLPATMLPALPEASRLFNEKEKQYEARQRTVRRAIRYNGLEGGESDV